LEQLPSPVIPMFDANDVIYNSQQIGYTDFMTDGKNAIDNIYSLFDYIKDNCDDMFRKKDAEICMKMFDYLLKTKKSIVRMINDELEKLRSKLTDWVQMRYCKEMENFSQRFMDIENIPLNEPIFVNIKDFADEERNRIVDRLGYRFSASKPLCIDEKRFIGLAEKMKDFQVASVEQFLEAAAACGFTQNEKDWLETLIIMSTIPGFIDVPSFLIAVSPDTEVTAKIERYFK
jgi:hypothetical protein